MIENVGGATVVTGARDLALASLLSMKGRLQLEAKGLKFRGRSTFAMVKERFGFKGSKASVLAQFEAHIKKLQAEREVTPPNAETESSTREAIIKFMNCPSGSPLGH